MSVGPNINYVHASSVRMTTNQGGSRRSEADDEAMEPIGLGQNILMDPTINPFTGALIQQLPITIPDSIAAMDVEFPIPTLRVEAYQPLSQEEKRKLTAYELLTALASKFGTIVQVVVRKVPAPGQEAPCNWQAHVNAALREGVGVGGTKSEAVNEACLVLIESMSKMLAGPASHHIRPFIKTDPAKDILYLLRKVCQERKLKLPTYEYDIEAKKSEGLIICDCVIGGHRIRVSATKKRVGCRQAALLMYKEVRECYNVRSLPESFYLDKPDEECLIEISN